VFFCYKRKGSIIISKASEVQENKGFTKGSFNGAILSDIKYLITDYCLQLL